METLRIGGRRYSDPDIISLCRQSGELIDPRSTIVNMARSLTEKADGFSGLPADPLERLKIIASLNRIKILPMDMDQVRREERDAALYPTASGWTVLFNPNRLRTRIIFTIAHEIVHTFFPNSTNGARFRSITNPSSREANELELLCHLGASELVMPLNEFQRRATGRFGLSAVEALASYFGTSFEATVYRLATAHPGLAVAGMLQYRLTKDEERRLTKTTDQGVLFSNLRTLQPQQPAERKYRRQSVHLSTACQEEEYTIRFNKSFDPSSVVYRAREGGIQSSVESLPNLANVSGRIEATLCPYQSDNSGADFGDVFFFWEQINNRV